MALRKSVQYLCSILNLSLSLVPPDLLLEENAAVDMSSAVAELYILFTEVGYIKVLFRS